MSIPSLLGPILTNTSFFIVSIQNGKPNVLVSAPITRGIQYYWESNINNLSSTIQPVVFSSQGTLDSLIITDITNNGGIGFREDTITIGHSLSPSTLKMSQPLFNNWLPPNIFLSSVNYTIFNSSGGIGYIQISPITNPTEAPLTIPANNIIILPIIWYFNCTSDGRYDIINQPSNSLINWFCLVDPNISQCSNITLAPGGWTNLSDCTNGVVYNYCAVNAICGTNNCNGPCPSFYDNCEYSAGNYSCTFDPDNLINGRTWYTSPYFIGSIVATIIIIIVLIILIIIVRRTNT